MQINTNKQKKISLFVYCCMDRI